MIFNAAHDEYGGQDRFGLMYANNDNVAIKKGFPSSFCGTNEYLWTIEKPENAAENVYCLKSVSNSKYASSSGALGTEATTIYITPFKSSPAPAPAAAFNDDGSQIIENGNIDATHNLFTIGNNNNQYWNGNSGPGFATWNNGHPYAFYEVEQVNTQALPELTTDLNNPKFYTIWNLRVKKNVSTTKYDNQYLSERPDGIDEGSFWFFTAGTAPDGTTVPDGVLPIRIHNASTTKLVEGHANYNFNTDGHLYYVIPHTSGGYTGVVISQETNANDWRAWNDNGGNYVCNYKGDDGGSIWVICPVSTSTSINYYVPANLANAKTTYKGEATAAGSKAFYAYTAENVNACKNAIDAHTATTYAEYRTAYNAISADLENLYSTPERTNEFVGGEYIKLENRNYPNHYMSTNGTQMISHNGADYGAVWKVEAVEGGFKLYNEYTHRYAGAIHKATEVTNNMADGDGIKAGIYSVSSQDRYEVLLGQNYEESEETPSDFIALHNDGSQHIVKWEASAPASQWTISAVTEAEISAFHEACKTNLETSITNGRTAANTFDTEHPGKIGTGLGFYHQVDFAAAQSLVDDYTNVTGYALDQAASHVATGVEINQPEVGKLYRFKGNVSGNKISAENGTTDHTDKLSMILDGHNSPETVFYYDGTKLVSFKKGLSVGGFTRNGSNWQCVPVGTEAGAVSFVEGSVVGTYRIRMDKGRDLYDGNTYVDAADANATGANYNWQIEQVEWLPVYISNEAHYATLYSPVSLALKDKTAAYVGTVNNNKLELTSVGTVIPAETAVILTKETDAEVDDQTGCVYFQVKPNETWTGNNALEGSYESFNTPSSGVYTLQQPEGAAIGMYKFVGPTLQGFKAYLPAEVAAGVKGFTFSFGDATGIENVLGNAQGGNASIYDLSGRRVEKAQKGLYIVNGKKVIIK